MKNQFKRVIRICAIVWAVLMVLTTVSEIVKYTTGGYVKMDATITWVNQFQGWSRGGGYYDRANGHLKWEYNGLVCITDERVDLPADAKEGDIKTIWIDAKTGEYATIQGLWYGLFGCAMHLLGCALILRFVKVKKVENGNDIESGLQ